ncbi:MAG: hypothetical protein HC884_16890 [Chloroflexaceae bacterium]|nr:hypothetical protein [Chloroflexaceae bacterium]
MSEEMAGTDVPDEFIYGNGINAVDSSYLLEPQTPDHLMDRVRGREPGAHTDDLKARTSIQDYRPIAGVDPNNLLQAGWGIIFARKDQPHTEAIRQALSPLLALRRKQAGPRYREFLGRDGYIEGESKVAFLQRFGVGSGAVDPNKGVPYYLLLVGHPEAIPYEVQYQLDVQFAVGRIHFEDNAGKPDLEAYARYAQSVVAAETGLVALPRKMAFFGVRNPDDPATTLSADAMIAPLADLARKDYPDWGIEVVQDTTNTAVATKEALGHLLGGDRTPAFLFTASHGMGFPNGHASQHCHQGALLCRDWPGPRAWRGKPVPPEHYFAGEDIRPDARLLGTIAFFFACYGAGTPQWDEFYRQDGAGSRTVIAPRSFLSRLPLAMLSHPHGGALAVVGHIDRAWGHSFLLETRDPTRRTQLQAFQSTFEELIKFGSRIGWAFEYLNQRYAEVSSDLTASLAVFEQDETYLSDAEKRSAKLSLAQQWTASNDARGYVLLGDPAVRLPIASDAPSGPRPTLADIAGRLPTGGAPSVDTRKMIDAARNELVAARAKVEALEGDLKQSRARVEALEREIVMLGGTLE